MSQGRPELQPFALELYKGPIGSRAAAITDPTTAMQVFSGMAAPAQMEAGFDPAAHASNQLSQSLLHVPCTSMCARQWEPQHHCCAALSGMDPYAGPAPCGCELHIAAGMTRKCVVAQRTNRLAVALGCCLVGRSAV